VFRYFIIERILLIWILLVAVVLVFGMEMAVYAYYRIPFLSVRKLASYFHDHLLYAVWDELRFREAWIPFSGFFHHPRQSLSVASPSYFNLWVLQYRTWVDFLKKCIYVRINGVLYLGHGISQWHSYTERVTHRCSVSSDYSMANREGVLAAACLSLSYLQVVRYAEKFFLFVLKLSFKEVVIPSRIYP
jgi:hypothetical protein